MDTQIDYALAYRQAQGEPVHLPSGATVLLRRPPLKTWMANGRMPQSLLNAAIQARADAGDDVTVVHQKTMEAVLEDNQKAIEAYKFMLEIVTYSMVQPALVEVVAGPNQIAMDELADDDFTHIVKWATRQLPEIVVGQQGGEPVRVRDLERFRDIGGDESFAHSGKYVPEIHAAPV